MGKAELWYVSIDLICNTHTTQRHCYMTNFILISKNSKFHSTKLPKVVTYKIVNRSFEQNVYGQSWALMYEHRSNMQDANYTAPHYKTNFVMMPLHQAAESGHFKNVNINFWQNFCQNIFGQSWALMYEHRSNMQHAHYTAPHYKTIFSAHCTFVK